MARTNDNPGTESVKAGSRHLAGAFIFRRRDWRLLMEQGPLALPAILLFLALWFGRFLPRVISAAPVSALVQGALLETLLLFVYFLLATFALAEPALNIILKASTADEPSLHWWAENRQAGRRGILLTLSFAFMLQALTAIPFGFGFLSVSIAIGAGCAYLTAMVVYGWNFPWLNGTMVAGGPALVLSGCASTLFDPAIATWCAVALLLLLPFALADLRHLFIARRRADALLAAGSLDADGVVEMLDEARLGGDRSAPQRVLKAVSAGGFGSPPRPAWIEVRLLSGAGLFMEAVDRGLEGLRNEEEGAALHLALSEALLAARDPDNAAAHAEEALERCGDTALSVDGCEALLLLAIAAFNNEEIESGLHALERLFARPEAEDRRTSRILAEAHILSRRFGRESMQEEV